MLGIRRRDFIPWRYGRLRGARSRRESPFCGLNALQIEEETNA
jgi:hypothetical protein